MPPRLHVHMAWGRRDKLGLALVFQASSNMPCASFLRRSVPMSSAPSVSVLSDMSDDPRRNSKCFHPRECLGGQGGEALHHAPKHHPLRPDATGRQNCNVMIPGPCPVLPSFGGHPRSSKSLRVFEKSDEVGHMKRRKVGEDNLTRLLPRSVVEPRPSVRQGTLAGLFEILAHYSFSCHVYTGTRVRGIRGWCGEVE